MDRLESMATFVRVVEAGSLSAAARLIPTSLTSVSRQVSALEAHLGTQLLRRTTRKLLLTEDGRLFYDRAKTILGELSEIEATLSSGKDGPSGRLHVSSPVLFGRLLLAPLLPAFLQQYRDVSVNLLLVDRVVNLVEEDVHVALRVGHLPDSQLVARKLAEVRMIVCASPDYLKQHGTPRTPSDLSAHDCLAFSDVPGSAEWYFQGPKGRIGVRVAGRLWINNLDALVAAAIDGAGLVRVPSWQVSGEIASGRLTRVLTDHERPPVPINVLFQPSKMSSPKIRVFVDYLVEKLTHRSQEALLLDELN
ncbi:MAG: LysR family transcriptional regulator [Bradyrhizobiaceae bacterium]|nr:MAG: LysR family transcriptional regulator [Bradyrhizobiaceae bacterium]